MRILGFQISRAPRTEKALSPISDRGWFPLIRESYTGAWQQNVTISYDSVLSNHADFACRTLIASDISKLRLKLVAKDSNGIWTETTNPAYSPVLRRPNGYQSRIQFIEAWVLSKLQRGNAYILKRRDGRGVVNELHVLDPGRVKALISDSGDVYYDLSADNMVNLDEQLIVPASEIIHDRFNCFFHPMVGLSPIFANGLAATQGLAIQKSSTLFFQNNSQPGGTLSAPGAIAQETADRLKAYWEANYSAASSTSFGKVAVLGDGLTYTPLAVKAVDAQLIDQLKWTAEVICSTYHVPPYKIGIGQMPTYNNIQSLNVEYYSQCLQNLIEAIELCLDEGLGIGEGVAVGEKSIIYGTEFDLDGLLRMDSVTQMTTLKEAVGAAVMAPNEARKKIDLPPVKGGEAPLSQQQNYSLEALAKRDAKEDPFATESTASAPPANDNGAAENAAQAAKALLTIHKGLS